MLLQRLISKHHSNYGSVIEHRDYHVIQVKDIKIERMIIDISSNIKTDNTFIRLNDCELLLNTLGFPVMIYMDTLLDYCLYISKEKEGREKEYYLKAYDELEKYMGFTAIISDDLTKHIMQVETTSKQEQQTKWMQKK